MNIPSLGSVRGFFEHFLPGFFMLGNLFVFGALAFFQNTTMACIRCPQKELLSMLDIGKQTVFLTIVIVTSYFVGVLMRLLKTGLPDRSSAWFLRFIKPNARRAYRIYKSKDPEKMKMNAEVLARHYCYFEEFPYVRWLGYVRKACFPRAKALSLFYENTWARILEGGRSGRQESNSQFLNLCKSLVLANDKDSWSDIYALEALVRFISGMFYAVLISIALILVGLVVAIIRWDIGLMIFLDAFFCLYLVCMAAILGNLRMLRIKEVEQVFAATFAHRELLYDMFGESCLRPLGKPIK